MAAKRKAPDPEREYLDARGVAARIGIKLGSISSYRSRGEMPEPDAYFLKHPLWLASTIDEWRKGSRTRRPQYRRRTGRKTPRRVETETLWEAPPRLEASGPASRNGAQAPPRLGPVDAEEARALAAAVRGAGFYCTTADVLELAERAATPALPRERELLRQRIIAKRRELAAH